MYSPSARKDSARSILEGKGTRVNDQRTNLRSEFLNRVRRLRIKEVDKFRCLSSDEEFTKDFLLELRQILLSDKVTFESEEEMSALLSDIDNEMLLLDHEQSEMKEAELVAQALMHPCVICDFLIYEGNFCKNCSAKHFNSD